MTNPATKIILPGSKDPVIPGDGAASLVEMIHALNRKAKSKSPNPSPKPETEKGKKKESASLEIISEADFAKMSEDEQRKALGG